MRHARPLLGKYDHLPGPTMTGSINPSRPRPRASPALDLGQVDVDGGGNGEPQPVAVHPGRHVGKDGRAERMDVHGGAAAVVLDPPEMRDPGPCAAVRLELPVTDGEPGKTTSTARTTSAARYAVVSGPWYASAWTTLRPGSRRSRAPAPRSSHGAPGSRATRYASCRPPAARARWCETPFAGGGGPGARRSARCGPAGRGCDRGRPR